MRAVTANAQHAVRIRASSDPRTRFVPLLLALCALTVLFATATPVRAAESTPATQAAYLAERLREGPVYVTDQLPREIPRSTAPDFARLAKKTGVPTYVLVLPAQSSVDGRQLLGAVHDRLGRDGLYVLVDDMAVAEATAYGVRAPADAASTVTQYELPYDAGPLLSFERFVDVVALGGEKASARAGAAREKYQGDEPAEMYIGPSDRRNQSFLTGILLTGVPLLILLVAGYAGRRRRRSGAERRVPRWVTPGAAVLTATAIALTAATVFDQTRSSAAPPPTPADLSARVERVAAGLKQDPVYADPESPRVLDARQLARLHDRIRDFRRAEGGGRVFVSLVPQTPESESAGDTMLFAAAVHAKVGEDGLYVVADPDDGTIDFYNHGLRRDTNRLAFNLPDSVTFGDSRADEADDHLLGERLDKLMTFLDETPRTDRPGSEPAPAAAPGAADENTLPPLFATDFWPGLFVGAFAALLLSGVVAGATWIVTGLRRRRSHAPEPAHLLPFTSPTEPSASYLRRTAYAELSILSGEFTDADENTRAWDCLDAAMLLLDGDLDRARSAETDAATLVAVVVLARAGRAALTGDTNDLCCGVNPLHGPAVSRHHVRVSAEGSRRRLLPVCEPCRDTAVAEPGGIPGRLLNLPGTASGAGGRPPYYDATHGPLSAVPGGIARLIDKVRETAGVH
ncbi:MULTISPECIES: hypothetical protein [Streptomyces]|uniref:Uncharacterized protein n=1 Tax=Streptomyces chartreusis NRRL 3882 TaxID=1079985 RepID=A0A2N9B959_STRCX|nr:hypothetical protein [Streptomyces chartreusis]SOR79880.1 hypothetical protein SCNRRL3882_3339 [Streptomyces chartreusis NRRL 3882]